MSIRNVILTYLNWWYKTWYLDMFKPKRIFQSFLIAIMGILLTTFILSYTIKM